MFNASQRARAQAADADALKATKQAEAARNQVSEETLRLQHAVAQMQAARDVAQLEYEIAQKNLAAVQTRMDEGTSTIHDLDDARSQSERALYRTAGRHLRARASATRSPAFNWRSGEVGPWHALVR